MKGADVFPALAALVGEANTKLPDPSVALAGLFNSIRAAMGASFELCRSGAACLEHVDTLSRVLQWLPEDMTADLTDHANQLTHCKELRKAMASWIKLGDDIGARVAKNSLLPQVRALVSAWTAASAAASSDAGAIDMC